MARSQLFKLITDVERLLTAGAQSVSGFEALKQHRETVAALAQSVPALNTIVESLDEVITAKPDALAHALLQLHAKIRVLRSSLAQPEGLEGEMTPAPDSGPWKTPLIISELFKIIKQLQSKAYHTRVSRYSAKAPIMDLRLAGFLLRWLDHRNDFFVRSLIEKVFPHLDPVLVQELQKDPFDLDEVTDMNRLIALSKLSSETTNSILQKQCPELIEELVSHDKIA